MPVSLAISDNGDGTGGVATVSGLPGPYSVQLYRAPMAVGPLSLSNSGSRIGNGTIQLSSPAIPLGNYLWIVEHDHDALNTAAVFQPLTHAPSASLVYRIIEAVILRTQALGLQGISIGNINSKWMGRALPADGPSFPKIDVMPFDAENFPGILTGADDIGYPIALLISDRQNQNYTGNLARNLLWRERIISRFRYQRLPGVAEVINCEPEPSPMVESLLMVESNLYQSLIVLRFITRTQRG